MASKGLFREEQELEKEKAREMARKRNKMGMSARKSDSSMGTGSLLMRGGDRSGPSLEDRVRLPGASKEMEGISKIINERSEYPVSREAATQQYNQDQASAGVQMASERRGPVSEKAKQAAKKKAAGSTSDSSGKLAAGLAMAGQMGGGLGNIAGGAASGAAFGPPGMIAGAALGAMKNLAANRQKTRDLKAKAILGQADAAKEASKGEREALQNIIEGLRAALIF